MIRLLIEEEDLDQKEEVDEGVKKKILRVKNPMSKEEEEEEEHFL